MKIHIFIFYFLMSFTNTYASICTFELIALNNLRSESTVDRDSVIAAYREIILTLDLDNLKALKESGGFELPVMRESKIEPIQDGLDLIRERAESGGIPKNDFFQILTVILKEKWSVDDAEKVGIEKHKVVHRAPFRIFAQGMYLGGVVFNSQNGIAGIDVGEIAWSWKSISSLKPESGGWIGGRQKPLALTETFAAFQSRHNGMVMMNMLTGEQTKLNISHANQLHFINGGKSLVAQAPHNKSVSVLDIATNSEALVHEGIADKSTLSEFGEFLFIEISDKNREKRSRFLRMLDSIPGKKPRIEVDEMNQKTKIIDLKSQTEITPHSWKQIPIHFEAVSSHGEFALSLNEDWLGVVQDELPLILWDVKGGNQRFLNFQIPGMKRPSRILITPDGKRIIIFAQGQVFILNAVDERIIARLDDMEKMQFELSPDGRILFGFNTEVPTDYVPILETLTGRQINIINAHISKIESVKFSPDSKFLISLENQPRWNAILWDLDKAVESGGE